MPDNFLGLPETASSLESSRAVILPIPYEATVSYGAGTALGPQAIITASQQVELFDREFNAEPAMAYGIHTLPAVDTSGPARTVLNKIAETVALHAGEGKFVVGLGGEHTVSLGVGRGLLKTFGEPLSVVQIDAHCDLRDQYEDSHFSHACVTRRLIELHGIDQVLQLGIRSLSTEEIDFAREHPDNVRIWYAEDVQAGDWKAELVARTRDRNIFLTIDVDGLDPAIVPATGTPEPDGLTWAETLEILRIVAGSGRIVGMDCVELAPVEGLHASDFAVAKLVYKAISLALFNQKGTTA